MNRYRPGADDPRTLRNYRDSDDDNSDSGFQIRGAANNNNNNNNIRRSSASRTRSPPRRQYREPEMARESNYRDDYQSRSDDRYDNSYSSSSDYTGRGYRGREHERRSNYRRDYGGRDHRDYYQRDNGGRDERDYHRRDSGRRNDRDYDQRDFGGRNYSSHRSSDRAYHDYEDMDPYSEPVQPPAGNGEDDVGDGVQPLQFLLIRGFKSSVDEARLSKDLEKLNLDDNSEESLPLPLPPTMPAVFPTPAIAKPTFKPGATPGSLKRVFLIRDRLSDKSLSYGFAEYHTVSDAKAALAKAEQLADKCTVASKQIKVDYIHPGVFPPLIPASSKATPDPKFTFQLRSGATHCYRDERYYASALDVNVNPPEATKTPAAQPEVNPKSGKKRPVNTQTLDALDSGNDGRKKAKTGVSKDLEIAKMWQKKQEELHGEDGGEVEDDEHTPNPLHPPVPANHDLSGANLGSGIVEDMKGDGQTFVAYVKSRGGMCCLLCSTKLPDKMAEKHVLESAAHKKNLEDAKVMEKAYERLESHGIDAESTLKIGGDTSAKVEWRDRAKERREAEAKTPKLKVSLKDAAKKGGKQAGGSKPVAPAYGVGMQMLKKAGWEEGKGLGSGDGIAAPIEAELYAAGVGLGHESSKKGDAAEEAARASRNDGFLEKTKEVARERFSRM